MKKLLLCILCLPFIAQAQCNPERDKYGHIARSKKVLSDFRKTVPCPGTGKTGKRCVGYVIDHVKPLCNCGPDAVQNLQWQTVAEAKVKDRWERRICRGQGD